MLATYSQEAIYGSVICPTKEVIPDKWHCSSNPSSSHERPDLTQYAKTSVCPHVKELERNWKPSSSKSSLNQLISQQTKDIYMYSASVDDLKTSLAYCTFGK